LLPSIDDFSKSNAIGEPFRYVGSAMLKLLGNLPSQEFQQATLIARFLAERPRCISNAIPRQGIVMPKLPWKSWLRRELLF
jgi:hypothetical protein